MSEVADAGPPVRRRELLAAAGLVLSGCQPAGGELAGSFVGQSHERGHRLRQGSLAPRPSTGAGAGATKRARVLIAGGGVAGLAAARRLALAGIYDFVLVDLEDEPGGNSRGMSVAGIACPMGAHYLPVPGEDGGALLEFLEQIGLRQRVAGRWVYDERHLCHSPQERLFFHGRWQEGLLPLEGIGAPTMNQYRRFASLSLAMQRTGHFTIPAARTGMDGAMLALDALTFKDWLDREGLDDPHLRWYLDYCCRDDYGAGIDVVSAWAGLHYFASRHGFSLPESGLPDAGSGLLTWPQGNAFLVRALSAPWLARDAGRLLSGCTVTMIRSMRHGVEVNLLRHASGSGERWLVDHCIVALPVFVAMKLLEQPPAELREAADRMGYAPWLVANIHVREPLLDPPGAAPAWDNVIYGNATARGGLGYVDAGHQKLDPTPGPTVLTHFRVPGIDPGSRQHLLQAGWAEWSQTILAELAQAHPDLRQKATRMDIVRYGHAMVLPRPGLQSHLRQATAALQQMPTGRSRRRGVQPTLRTPVDGRLLFAHSDWSGYSIFEEAFARGDAAAALLA